jgi:hypothetical protein
MALVQWQPSMTIPIFHLGQNPTQTITNIVNNQLKIEVQSKTITATNTTSATSLDIDWSTCLSRPASSAAEPIRRECKVDKHFTAETLKKLS